MNAIVDPFLTCLHQLLEGAAELVPELGLETGTELLLIISDLHGPLCLLPYPVVAPLLLLLLISHLLQLPLHVFHLLLPPSW